MSFNSSIIDVRDDNIYGSEALSLSKRSNTVEEKQQKQQVTIRERLGLEDFRSAKVWQAALVELMGTAILVFMSDAIAISTVQANIGNAPTLIISILNGITIAFLVFATMPISGGHLIPLISLFTGLMGLVSLSRAFLYILAQCLGGILAALALELVLNSDTERNFLLGGCTITTAAQSFYLEFICCFILLFTLRWIAFDQKQAQSLGKIVICSCIGLIVGLNIFFSSTVTGVKGYSGAGINSARCLGPAIVRGGDLWNGHWVFWVGPAMASISFYIFMKIVRDSDSQDEENIHDFQNILIALSKRKPYAIGCE